MKSPDEYVYSSYNAFALNLEAPNWLNTGFILSMFSTDASEAKRLYKQFVIGNIGQEKEIINKNTRSGFLIGGEEFSAYIKEKFIDPKCEEPEVPVLRRLKARIEPSMELIQSIVEKRVADNKKFRRSLSIYLSRKYTQKTLDEIAGFYGGIQYTAVSQVWRRIEMKKGKDKSVAKLLLELESEIMEYQSKE